MNRVPKRESDENVEKYLDRFKRCYKGVVSSSKLVIIPEEIRPFMVLRKTDPDEEDEEGSFVKEECYDE